MKQFPEDQLFDLEVLEQTTKGLEKTNLSPNSLAPMFASNLAPIFGPHPLCSFIYSPWSGPCVKFKIFHTVFRRRLQKKTKYRSYLHYVSGKTIRRNCSQTLQNDTRNKFSFSSLPVLACIS